MFTQKKPFVGMLDLLQCVEAKSYSASETLCYRACLGIFSYTVDINLNGFGLGFEDISQLI